LSPAKSIPPINKFIMFTKSIETFQKAHYPLNMRHSQPSLDKGRLAR